MDELVLINVPWSQAFSDVLRFWSLVLLTLVFSLIFMVASRLLHPYNTNDKTSRLKAKRFSTVRDTQRGSQSYMKKKKREQGDRGDQEKKRGTQRGSFAICSPQAGTLREVHGVPQRREKGGRR